MYQVLDKGGFMKKDHLDMIQRVIDRMGNNSFLLKGWAVLVIVAIFTLAGESKDISCVLFTIVPLVVFWGLDSYYLQLERKYRKLYDWVRKRNNKKIDFNMNPNQVKLNIEDSKNICFVNCLISKTEFLFYGTCIVTTILIYIFA